MPFITPQDRLRVEVEGLPHTVGDLCYIVYKQMVTQWKNNPRWTTAHEIYRELGYGPQILSQYNFTVSDCKAASELAWQVFFQNYVMPYERVKEQENGTI